MKISFFVYNLLFTLLSVGLYNFYFLSELFKAVSIFVFIPVLLIVYALFLCFHAMIFWPKTVKILSTVLILLNGICAYFISAYHIVFNKAMLRNILDTNFTEASEWLGISFWLYVLFVCLLPIFLLWRCQIVFAPFRQGLKHWLCLLLVTLVLGAALALPNRMSIKIFLKENFNLRYMILPTSCISSAIGLVRLRFKNVDLIDTTAGMTQAPYWNPSKKMLIVFVLGESARYQSYPLTENARTTGALKPYLPEMTIFRETQACGVATNISVPCLFSGYRQSQFSQEAAFNTPNILDILNSNHWNMLWLDNEMGCNRACRGIPTEMTCHARDCTDDVLNARLKEVLPTLAWDSFIVLHQRGSHGPRYDLRVPKKYRVFKPFCKRADFQNCSQEELNNAYDNTLLYTSELLADLMKTLNAYTNEFYPVLIFVSDHGESLGEGGFYAHATDYRIAPQEQKQVPFFIYIPDQTRQELHLNEACLTDKTSTPQSHDVIFHTIMGLSGIRTNIYDSALDMFSGCIGQ